MGSTRYRPQHRSHLIGFWTWARLAYGGAGLIFILMMIAA